MHIVGNILLIVAVSGSDVDCNPVSVVELSIPEWKALEAVREGIDLPDIGLYVRSVLECGEDQFAYVRGFSRGGRVLLEWEVRVLPDGRTFVYGR